MHRDARRYANGTDEMVILTSALRFVIGTRLKREWRCARKMMSASRVPTCILRPIYNRFGRYSDNWGFVEPEVVRMAKKCGIENCSV